VARYLRPRAELIAGWCCLAPAHIITGLRIGLATHGCGVVAAELIAASGGVGYIIVDGREMSRPDLVIAGIDPIA